MKLENFLRTYTRMVLHPHGYRDYMIRVTSNLSAENPEADGGVEELIGLGTFADCFKYVAGVGIITLIGYTLLNN